MIVQLVQEERNVLNKLCMSFFNDDRKWQTNIEYLFANFFNPKTQKKTIYASLQSLRIKSITKSYDLNVMLHLENKGLVEVLDNGKYVLPRPLGVLVFIHGGIIPDDDILYLVNYYHKVADLKLRSVINEFGKIKMLRFSEIAPLIFLLYNNNTSRYRGKFEKDITLKHAIDRINSAFVEANPNSQGTKDRNASLSGYYLTQANNKLGIPIFNEEPYYYIKHDRIKDVEGAIRKSIKNNSENANNSFKAFEEAFEKESKILFKCEALYSTSLSKESVRNLFKEAYG